ncbi:hypothetical protein FB451DRAFT_465197 [Mycena latifolia]|nr:hypothetical protein FB451DRAFT_465197 [Mycena latifolia]
MSTQSQSALAFSSPHPQRSLFSPTIASQLRSRLVDIECQVADLESQLARLRVEKEGVLASLDSLIYPILTLPPEITSEIFVQYVDSFNSPLPLAGVCRAWRAIAVSTPRLWIGFYVGSRRADGWYPENLLRLLQCWFSRSGDLPLTLYVELPTGSQDAIISTLTQHASQWISLDLRSTRPLYLPIDSLCAPYSSLQTLKLDIHRWDHDATCITAFLNAPRLQNVRLSNLKLAHISLPWGQLTNLDLWGQSLEECLDILAQTPNLESLTLSLIWSEQPALIPLTFPHLRTLSLMPDPDLTLFNFLTLPALERLELSEISQQGAAAVESLITRSRCSLRALALSQTMFTPAYECFWTLESLAEVSLRFAEWHKDDFSHLFETLTENRAILPGLETLNIDQCVHDVDVHDLATMLSARSRGIEGTAKLKSFRLSFDADVGAMSVRRALTELASLRVEGVKIDLTSLPKWATRNINSHMMDDLATYEYERRMESRAPVN